MGNILVSRSSQGQRDDPSRGNFSQSPSFVEFLNLQQSSSGRRCFCGSVKEIFVGSLHVDTRLDSTLCSRMFVFSTIHENVSLYFLVHFQYVSST